MAVRSYFTFVLWQDFFRRSLVIFHIVLFLFFLLLVGALSGSCAASLLSTCPLRMGRAFTGQLSLGVWVAPVPEPVYKTTRVFSSGGVVAGLAGVYDCGSFEPLLHDFPKPLALATAQGCGMGGRAAPLASLLYPAVVAQRNES